MYISYVNTIAKALLSTAVFSQLTIFSADCPIQMSGIPYSGKLLREKTFVNWWKRRFSRRKLSRIATPRTPHPQFSRRKLSGAINREIWESFSLESVPLYGRNRMGVAHSCCYKLLVIPAYKSTNLGLYDFISLSGLCHIVACWYPSQSNICCI